MKTASIVHPSLNRAGGAERYLLELVNVLQKAGYSVCLYTVDKTDWEKLEEIQGISTRPDKEIYRQEKRLEPSNLFSWIKAASIYTWLLVRAREESDLSINNYGEVLPIISDISIVHAVPVIAKNGNAYNIPLWDVLQPIFRYLHGALTKKTSKLIITNSRYNEKKVNAHYHTETKVVNPPIATASYYGEKKNGRILSIARISPNKNLQKITQIANRSHRNRFIIAGKTSQNSEKILRVLREMRNIEVYINPPRASLIELMQHSSILLSTQPDEAFGMAVVEAMSMGCIPVVYRDGGPWTDILGETEGVYGYAYENAVEATERIEEILGDGELRARLRENSIQRSKEFDSEKFGLKILKIIEDFQYTRGEDWLTKGYKGVRKIGEIKALSLRR